MLVSEGWGKGKQCNSGNRWNNLSWARAAERLSGSPGLSLWSFPFSCSSCTFLKSQHCVKHLPTQTWVTPAYFKGWPLPAKGIQHGKPRAGRRQWTGAKGNRGPLQFPDNLLPRSQVWAEARAAVSTHTHLPRSGRNSGMCSTSGCCAPWRLREGAGGQGEEVLLVPLSGALELFLSPHQIVLRGHCNFGG